MKIGIVKETYLGERRVALTPNLLPTLTKLGQEILVQTGAGKAAGFPDHLYSEKGAKIGTRSDAFAAAVIVQVRALGANPDAGRSDLDHLDRSKIVIGMCDPLSQPKLAQEVAQRGATMFSLELMPRHYSCPKHGCALEHGHGRRVPRGVAGRHSPAEIVSDDDNRRWHHHAGQGVHHRRRRRRVAGHRQRPPAGSAQVSATDVRAAVREQVQSLGARFVETPVDASKAEGTGGYAKALDEESYQKQRDAMAKVVAESDVVITTAAVPGRRAQILVTTDMVHLMQPGSVLVDLAAERGGNCELTKPGDTVIVNGVTIIGPENLPSEVPYHASQMFGKNAVTFLQHLLGLGLPATIDMADEITRETLVCRDGEVLQPRVRQLLGLETKAAQTV